MAKAKTEEKSVQRKKQRPAITPEARENQLISMAMDVVEERMMNGTASAQEIVHFLKLGCTKEQLEKEKLKEENRLLREKTKNAQSQQRIEELYSQAIAAMRRYSGQEDPPDVI